MEATGAYHLPLLSCFKQAGLFVSVFNPLAMKKYVSTTLRKEKADKLDSIRIANYGIDNWFKLTDYALPGEIYAQLRLPGRQYAHYITIKIKSKLALTDLLDRTMPGIKKLLSGKRSEEPTEDKLSDFVEEYWHYDNITKKNELQFVRCYCTWAKKKGYHASESKAFRRRCRVPVHDEKGSRGETEGSCKDCRAKQVSAHLLRLRERGVRNLI
jgi:hypothetical protein